MERTIFHIDLNAFFAEAEILLNPALKGLPIAVSGLGRRSVVSTASYEARAMGVHSAMPTSEAIRLCPNLILIPGHYDWYEQLSHQFLSFVSEYSQTMEQASIDECYVDMTSAIQNETFPLDLALRLQKGLLERHNLKCSIGIASNKFLAKMASGMKKPMGITVIRKEEIAVKLWPLHIGEMHGIGKKTAPQLENLGIMTIGDLAEFENMDRLRTVLGNQSMTYRNLANGIDESPVLEREESKSFSVSTTMNQNIEDYEDIRQIVMKLSTECQERCEQAAKAGTLICLTVRTFDFKTIAKSRRTENPISTKEEIFQLAMLLFDEAEISDPIRLLGISLQHLKLKSRSIRQTSLFSL